MPPSQTVQPPALPAVLTRLLVVSFLIYYFRIEGHAFAERVIPIAVLAFLPHHFVSPRYRLPLFVALSLATIVAVLGIAGLWLMGVVALFIVACHLPLPMRGRVAVVVALGVVLGVMRAGVVPPPWPVGIWPVLMSVLMFRTIGYLYDLRYQKAPPGLWPTLAYFFLLPNVAFPLFPVVDFATMKRTYYDAEPTAIYERGVEWMLRGLAQLVLYRIVYQYAVLAPADVQSTRTLVQYLLANFGLYLRVSGTFHLVVGILHLYGFHLPETHRLFYLASGFTDFWRRINIYWKDFMQKVVFAPVFHPLRKRIGDTRALAIATIAVFFVTWVTHGYQWFWILGDWKIGVTDSLFWGILGAILVVTSHRELRRGRTRTVGGAVATSGVSSALSLGVRTGLTFSVIGVLWGLWTSPTVAEFWRMLRVVRPTPAGMALILAVPLTVGIIAVAVDRVLPWYDARMRGAPLSRFSMALAPVAILAIVTQPRVAGALGRDAHHFAMTVRSNGLNRADAAVLQRGYYEKLLEVDRFNGELSRLYAQQPREWVNMPDSKARRPVHNLLVYELQPSSATYFKGITLHTNEFGMRGRQTALAKPAGVWRIALLGKSHVLGEGVEDDSIFPAIVERRLNSQPPRGARRIEILNFAVSGYTPVEQAYLVDDDRIRRFSPDVVLMVGHTTDLHLSDHIRTVVDSGFPMPYDTVRALVVRSGVKPGMKQSEVRARMNPVRLDLLGWYYGHIADAVRAMGAIPAWVNVPLPLDRGDEVPIVTRLARKAGFTVLDIPDMFLGHDETGLAIATWDNHPNREGHRIIAERLLDALQRQPELLGRGPAVISTR